MYKKLSIALLGLLFAVLLPSVAKAETVIERAARTRVITMGGRADVIPYSYVNDKGELVGYSIDVASLIEQEVSRYLGKPVQVKFETVNNISDLMSKVRGGTIDLACNTQFTWEREMFADFSIPYSLSGIRLLTKKGGLNGTPESMAGKRIGVLPNSLGESTIKLLQPKAVRVTFAGEDEAIAALAAGKVDAIAGDSIVLAGGALRVQGTQFDLVPTEPYIRYAVSCMVPENNSTFRNLVNLAIAKMAMGYLLGDAKYTAMVNKWIGPKGIVELPEKLIKDYFEMVMLNHEQLPITETRSATQSNK